MGMLVEEKMKEDVEWEMIVVEEEGMNVKSGEVRRREREEEEEVKEEQMKYV